VHSGYGQEAWQTALQDHDITVLHSVSAAEGAYVRVPEDKSAEDIVIFLTEINKHVRRRTRFRDMVRANKSRLHFKCEPFVVTPDADQVPALVRTSRFVTASMQWHGSDSGPNSGTTDGTTGTISGRSVGGAALASGELPGIQAGIQLPPYVNLQSTTPKRTVYHL
jgi:uncharacterized glyoxalase superfamily metalloenzyme YdcJ